MSADAPSIPAEALLRHRAFVQSLARSLVRDEHAAQDLVQETWLEALRHPPRSAAALPAWLARVVRTRAQNAARGEARRASREAAAAREESDESDGRLHERVAMQHKVVEAVLALKEPYRTVVLLRYYEGLPPAEIAARRGVPEGTVRAQVSRAHDLLRERLDEEFGGSRAAWCAGIVSIFGKPSTPLVGTKVAIAGGAVLLAGLVATVAWSVLETRASGPKAEALLASSEPANAVIAPSLDPTPAPASPAPARTPVPAPQGPLAKAPADTDLAALSIEDSLVLARQVQRELQKRLLVPDTDDPVIHEALRRQPDLQLARILPYGVLEGDIDGRFLGIRGAGAYFSFFTRSSNYDQQPDIHLDSAFSAGAYGGTAGFLVDLGDVELAELGTSQASRPPRSESLTPAVWDLFWTDAKTTGRQFDRAIEKRAEELQVGNRADAVLEHTYLVRAILPGEHDVLAAFRVLSKDDYGCTFGWRLIHSWETPSGGNKPRQAEVAAPAAPPWLAKLEVRDLMELSHRIRAASQPKLFPPRPDLDQKYPSIFGEAAAGVARMLHRGRFDAILDGRERGAYYSFATRSNDFDSGQDVVLEQDQFHPSARSGLLIPLGKLDLAAVVRAGESGLAGLEGNRLEAWRLLWTVNHDLAEFGRGFSRQEELRIRELDLPYSAPAVVGHSYLLRSIEPEKHDLLVAFTVLEKDDHGVWLAWRVLKSW